MKLPTQIKLIKGKAIVQDMVSYEQEQEALALLQIIALGQAQIVRGEMTPAREAIAQIRSDLRVNAERNRA